MSLLNITPGIGMFSDTGRIFSQDPLNVDDAFRSKVFERDQNSCQYCGFIAEKYQQIHFTGNDASKQSVDDYVTACVFCHQCFYLDRISVMQSGTVIWLPEIGQAALNHICRAIYIARITQGAMADAAREILDVLMSRKEESSHRLGTDDPRILASVLQDFLESKEYKVRSSKLKGFRVLPLDRRIIREGELEYNQFPQVLAYWRSKNGPFGPVPPRSWTKLFFDTKEKL